MEEGQFYASKGVELKNLIFNNNTLNIEVEKEAGISYEISFIGCKKGKSDPVILMSTKGDKASFELGDEILYVRCKITSSKKHSNPIENLLFETAWTRPVQYLKLQ